MTNNLSSSAPYLVIVAVVAVVAVATLVTNNTSGSNLGLNVQGAPVADFVDGCYESDPDYKFEEKGFVQVGSDKKFDYCVGDVLHQYSCEGKVARLLRPIDCQFGCENGICLSEPKYGQ